MSLTIRFTIPEKVFNAMAVRKSVNTARLNVGILFAPYGILYPNLNLYCYNL